MQRDRRACSPRRSVTILFVLLAAALLAPPAAAWKRPVYKGRVQAADLSSVRAKVRVRDAVVPPGRARASLNIPTRVEQYTDDHGHRITIGTTLPLLDLYPFAAVLAGTVHRAELNELRTLVVPVSQVPATCGLDVEIVGCYRPDSPESLRSGLAVVSFDYPHRTLVLVHEYGHHMDNQLLNRGHLGGRCRISNDGSRRWHFARRAQDRVFRRAGCGYNVAYDWRLNELFAQDFVVMNGIGGWQSKRFPRPTRNVLAALRKDITNPFFPGSRLYQGTLHAGDHRRHRFRLGAPTYFLARLRGPRGTDFDLKLIRRAGRRPRTHTYRRGSRERIKGRIGPGTYVLDVHADRGGGAYRLGVFGY